MKPSVTIPKKSQINGSPCELRSTAIPGPIHTKTHGHLWPISHKPGTVFNSPETQQWAVHGQPTCPTSVPPFGTEFLTHFLSYKHQSIIYRTNYDTKLPNSPRPLIFWAVTATQRIPKKFQQFGPKFWDRSNGPSTPQTNRNIEKPLKMGIKRK